MRHEADEDLARRYVAGKLSPTDAERFEEHYFGCEACWREVENATELRVALLPEIADKPAAPRRRAIGEAQVRRLWPALAAAAIAAFLFFGVWQLVEPQREPVEPVWRGDGQPIFDSTVSRTGEKVSISWQAQPDARLYSVEFLASTGTSTAKREVTTPRIELTMAEIGPATHYRILALDSFRSVIADSSIRPLQ